MAAISRVVLSGTPASGRVIPIAAIGTPGTLIHTAHATALDAVYLWASNVTRSAATLTIEWGGVLDPGDQICRELVIRANSAPLPILMGQTITGGLIVRAFSGTANALNVSGFVTRIT